MESESWLPEGAAQLIKPGNSVVIGSAAQLVVDAARADGEDAVTRPCAKPGAPLLARLASEREPDDHPPEPLYIRAPDAKLPEARPLREARRD